MILLIGRDAYHLDTINLNDGLLSTHATYVSCLPYPKWVPSTDTITMGNALMLSSGKTLQNSTMTKIIDTCG